MKISFRQFMNNFCEAEAAPSIGANPPEEKDNSHHFDFLKRQLGIGDDEFDAIISSGEITIYKMPDYSKKWGFLVNPPVNAFVEKQENGNFYVYFMLKNKKTMSPKSFFLPYKEGESPIYYQGPVEDKTEIMNERDLQDCISKPYEQPTQPNPMGGM